MKHINNYIERKTSCLTGSTNFGKLAVIDEFPVFFGVTDLPENEDLYAKMEWFVEEETGLIQLNNLIPLDILYQSQHAYGFGETWEKHYQEFSQFIMGCNPENVLEIGGGQGRIAQICTGNSMISNWTIIEPNPTFKETKKIKVVEGFFDKSVEIQGEFDTYTFSHVLEHAYDPREFLSSIYDRMNITDRLIFSYPNLKSWLSNKYTNSLNFEHTMLLTDSHLDSLLKSLGFKIVNKMKYIEHSHFYLVQKNDPKEIPDVTYENLFDENSKLLKDFINFHEMEVEKLNSYIIENSTKEIYLFGAHIFSQYLKVFGLDTKNIVGILDNSKEKQGKRLYGTELFVKSPDVLQNVKEVAVILRAGPYNEEIKRQLLGINKNIIVI